MITYVVKQGHTLFDIAQKFGISLAALEAANPQIPDFDKIFPGQVINIPVGPFPPPGTYVDQPGDTLVRIRDVIITTGFSYDEVSNDPANIARLDSLGKDEISVAVY